MTVNIKINECLSPVSGIFAAMPTDIWGPELDMTSVDIELWTRIGELPATHLFRYFVDANKVLDTGALASLLYQRFAPNWKRIFVALRYEYVIEPWVTL